MLIVMFGSDDSRSRGSWGFVSESTTVGNNVVDYFYEPKAQFISGLASCVHTKLFAYFGGYNNSTYSSGYLLL